MVSSFVSRKASVARDPVNLDSDVFGSEELFGFMNGCPGVPVVIVWYRWGFS